MQEDMMIHYDLEQVLEVLDPLEKNYQEHLKLSNSFMGWLLTLNKQEFKLVYDSITINPEEITPEYKPYLFKQVEMLHEGNPIITMAEFKEDAVIKREFVIWIAGVKDGYMIYTPSEKGDLHWEFEVTDKGIEYMRGQGVNVEDYE